MIKMANASLNNLIRDASYNGWISKRTTKRIQQMIEAFTTSVQQVRNQYKKIAVTQKIQNTFITLTLPYKQFHDDKVIKRKCLTPFIAELKKFHNVRYFIWRAEPQENGNIHFHILVDRFVSWQDVRCRWNRIVGKLEYLDAFEQKHGHRNPNSTDIHGLKGINQISSYIVKYMTKDKPRRKIEGRIWGCSSDFHLLKNPRLIFDAELWADYMILKKECKIFERTYEFCAISAIKLNDITKFTFSKLADIYRRFVFNNLTINLISNGA